MYEYIYVDSRYELYIHYLGGLYCNTNDNLLVAWLYVTDDTRLIGCLLSTVQSDHCGGVLSVVHSTRKLAVQRCNIVNDN